MIREDPRPLAESLRLPRPPVESRWTLCEGCGEEWRLPAAMIHCPDCSTERARQRLLEERRQDRQGVLRRAGIPRRHWKVVRVGQWPKDPRYRERDLRTWRGEPWSVTIQGKPGVGKSQLAVELAYRWLCADPDLQDVFWIRGGTLVRAIFRDQVESERARACQLLILDDYGQGLSNPTAWLVLGEILAERYDRERATLITTNLNQAALERAHSVTADRLLDGLRCGIQGSSRRGP